MSGGSGLFVYYKVDPALHDTWAERARTMQSRLLQQWPGLESGLLQRPGMSEGLETWMETYRHDAGLSDAMVAAIARAALQAGLPTPRHVEYFVALR